MKSPADFVFYYNAFLVISDGVNTKAGTITAPYDRFMAWKKINIEDEIIDTLGIDYRSLDTLLYGMFDKQRFLDIIKNFIHLKLDISIFSPPILIIFSHLI